MRCLIAILFALFLTPGVTAKEQTAPPVVMFNRLDEAIKHLQHYYINDLDYEKLTEAALKGIVTSLDAHSTYLTPARFRNLKYQSIGEFGGVGVELQVSEGVIRVITAIDETPAAEAGIRTNDIITHIDDTEVTAQNAEELVDRLRGPVNGEIKLRLRRAGNSLDVTLKRALIQVPAVRWRLEQQVGYVRIITFNDRTEAALRDAIVEIKDRLGEDLRGVVLDLRNNAGGLLDQAIKVVDTLLDGGEIVSTRGRDGAILHRYVAHPGEMLPGVPVVVLINAGSASAAEIVAGALQDHHRACVLGQRSFGKGSAQKIIPLSNGGALKLTVERYFTPAGHEIQYHGIVPNIEIPTQLTLKLTDKLTCAEHEQDLPGALTPVFTQPAGGRGAMPESLNPAVEQDYALRRAIDLLMARAFFWEQKGRAHAG